MEPASLALLTAASFITGALDASVGGGGLLLVPALTLLGLPIKGAIGTTRLTFLMDSLTAFLGHLRAGNVELKGTMPVFLLLSLGSVAGTGITHSAPPELVRGVFSIFIVLMAAALFIRRPRGQPRRGYGFLLPGALLIGVLIGMFGAGLGTVTIIFLALAGFRLLNAVGTSQAMVFVANIFALGGYLSHGYVDLYLGIFTGAFASLGALAGVRMAILAGEKRLKALLFAVVLVMAGSLLSRQ